MLNYFPALRKLSLTVITHGKGIFTVSRDCSMISRFTERNEFGGYTWQIKNSSTVRVHIKGSATPSEYVIEIQEFGWVRWSAKRSKMVQASLPDTIRRAFDLLYDFFDSHDDFDVPATLKSKELARVLSGLEKSKLYVNQIEPRESTQKPQMRNSQFQIDGFVFNLPPRHKKMSVSSHVSLDRFSKLCRVLSEKDIKKIENGDKVVLENVRLGKVQSPNKDETYYTFNVISTVDEEKISTYVFKEDGTLYINYDQVNFLDYSHPVYADVESPLSNVSSVFGSKESTPKIPEGDLSVGDRFTVTLEMGFSSGHIMVSEFER
jgi:hypothetical protein